MQDQMGDCPNRDSAQIQNRPYRPDLVQVFSPEPERSEAARR